MGLCLLCACRTVSRWHSSLVVKRVFFECFDCFMPLFYIAFYQLDVITLRAEIVSLFMSESSLSVCCTCICVRLLCFIWYPGDEIRRVLVETVIPFAKELFISGVEKKRGRKGFIPDAIRAEYDQFDDYLEMIIQFGVSTTCFVLFLQLPKAVILCSAVCLCDLTVGVSVCVHVIFCIQTKCQWQ